MGASSARGWLAVLLAVTVVTLTPHSALSASNFRVQQITAFGNEYRGSQATPLGVINDQLLFVAIEDDQWSVYRTDGGTVQPISSSQTIESVWNTTAVQLGNELFFVMVAEDGQELYASDGYSVRQVADIAPGPLNALPSDFQVLNDNLLFQAISEDSSMGPVPRRFFHTDGTTVEEFPVRNSSSRSGSATLGGQLYFGGHPVGVDELSLYATDGQSLTEIPLPPNPDAGHNVTNLTRAGNAIYMIAGGLETRGIYRTEGSTVDLVATIHDLDPNAYQIEAMFELDGSLSICLSNLVSEEVVFFNVVEGTPIEVLRWPASLNLPSKLPQLLFSDGSHAYFSMSTSAHNELYVFDGASFDQLTDSNQQRARFIDLVSVGERQLVRMESIEEPFLESFTYEIVNGELQLLGPFLEAPTQFAGELFGFAPDFNAVTYGTAPLMRTENGQLVFLSDATFVGGLLFTNRLAEFQDRLYFNGVDGLISQLYAVVPIPEPGSAVLLLGASAVLLLTRRRSVYSHWLDCRRIRS